MPPYKKPSDYVWALNANRAGAKGGKQPVWLSMVMRDYIQPAARKLGINKKMSWHTFRHTFSSILKANGEDVKVVQELLRRATAKMTLDTYTQALSPQKRAAQSKVVGMIWPKEPFAPHGFIVNHRWRPARRWGFIYPWASNTEYSSLTVLRSTEPP